MDLARILADMPKLATVNRLSKVIVAACGVILFLVFFLLFPIISFSCTNGLFTTTGSVSLSCQALGFGEIDEQALGISSYGWSNNCSLTSGPVITCATNFVIATVAAESGMTRLPPLITKA